MIFLRLTRFCCTKVPNGWTKFFLCVFRHFWWFLLVSAYSSNLLNPLFPRAPELSVVKHVVKRTLPASPGDPWPVLAGSVFSPLWLVALYLWGWFIATVFFAGFSAATPPVPRRKRAPFSGEKPPRRKIHLSWTTYKQEQEIASGINVLLCWEWQATI